MRNGSGVRWIRAAGRMLSVTVCDGLFIRRLTWNQALVSRRPSTSDTPTDWASSRHRNASTLWWSATPTGDSSNQTSTASIWPTPSEPRPHSRHRRADQTEHALYIYSTIVNHADPRPADLLTGLYSWNPLGVRTSSQLPDPLILALPWQWECLTAVGLR